MPEAQPAVFPPIRKTQVTVLQFNIGRLCNQACQHCHVDSSPKKIGSGDNASAELIDEVLAFLEANPGVHTLDITGGAPEMNANFRRLVEGARALDRKVLVRHNITVQFEEGMADLPHFFKQNQVELFCSLPCYSEENVDLQRGRGVFERSIQGLKNLNSVGFGMKGSGLDLHLVYNPVGANLPPAQEELEPAYHAELKQQFGIVFNHLLTITNQPIHRFKGWLERSHQYDSYMDLLRDHYNPSTLAAVMCRNALSLRWDGLLYDCDFNLVKGLAMVGPDGQELGLADLEQMHGLPIQVDDHCFACTAGAGSSCGGALVV